MRGDGQVGEWGWGAVSENQDIGDPEGLRDETDFTGYKVDMDEGDSHKQKRHNAT